MSKHMMDAMQKLMEKAEKIVLRPVRFKLRCFACKEGYYMLGPQGDHLSMWYDHICPLCKDQQSFCVKFPIDSFEEIKEGDPDEDQKNNKSKP